jgi:tetratricopeptide (TPR) repeat protein
MEKRMMRKRLIIILLLAPFLVFWHWFEPAARKNREGIKIYQEQKYQEALNEFMTARGIRPDSPELKNNTAAALYQLGKYEKALEEFSKIEIEKTTLSKSDFSYNLGNSFFRLNRLDKALKNYKDSLIANPDDIDAKKNYEITLKKLEEQKKKDQEDKKKKNQDKDKDKDKNKDKKKEKQPPKEQKKKDPKYENIKQYLNQNEKKQMGQKKRPVPVGIARKEKDW